MASPRSVVFAIFDATTKAPVTGAAPTFAWYSDETGASLTQPPITEIGGGMYKFTPTLTANHLIAYMLDCGVGAYERYPYDEIRPEDFDVDKLAALPTAAANAAAMWDEARSGHVSVGSFGDLMRLLFLVLAGHVKVDLGSRTLYQEDGSTIFHTQVLRKGGAAGGLDATEALAAVRP